MLGIRLLSSAGSFQMPHEDDDASLAARKPSVGSCCVGWVLVVVGQHTVLNRNGTTLVGSGGRDGSG